MVVRNPISLLISEFFLGKAFLINEIDENRLIISDLDILDGTPVLDIKPYFRELNSSEKVTTGWMEKCRFAACF